MKSRLDSVYKNFFFLKAGQRSAVWKSVGNEYINLVELTLHVYTKDIYFIKVRQVVDVHLITFP